jgi:23S rRNA (adenine2503-C2)-methyltransferase
MDISKLEKVLENESKYRLKQANEAVFKNYISDWSEATFFAKDLRDKLNIECPLKINADVLVSKKEDSVKAKITLDNGFEIETVLMRHEDGRNTVCVSSQVGCPLGCLFCATGKMGLKRNLTSLEIIEQVLFFDRYLKPEGKTVTNITFMGMGEPFLNYDNVWEAVKIFNDHKFFNIGVRSISISTAGIIDGIKRLSDEALHVNLAISLHAPNDNLRRELMPIDKKYPLEEVLKVIDEYIEKTNRKVMFEYVLIDGVNDTDDCARQLAKIMNKKLHMVNLILYNETGVYKASTTERVEAFKEILNRAKIHFTQRYRFGDDIQAACGQFATNK